MSPARQRLKTRNAIGLQRNNRLIVKLQFIALQCIAQVAFQRQTGLRLFAHQRAKEHPARLTLALCLVHGNVSIAQNIIGLLIALGINEDANTGGDEEELPLQRERLLQRGQNLDCQCGSILLKAGILDQKDKLITAQARNGVATAQTKP